MHESRGEQYDLVKLIDRQVNVAAEKMFKKILEVKYQTSMRYTYKELKKKRSQDKFLFKDYKIYMLVCVIGDHFFSSL